MIIRCQKPDQYHQHRGYDHCGNLPESPVDPDTADRARHRRGGIYMLDKNIRRHACHHITQQPAAYPGQCPQKGQKERIIRIAIADPGPDDAVPVRDPERL